MSTNVFFNNFGASSEQLLIEELIIESIRIYGHDVFYLPRKTVDVDDIFNEDTLTKFDDTYSIEMYIKNIEGFDGEGDFVSRFGLEVRDRITFTVSKRKFEEDIASLIFVERPQEGDLIFFPLNKKMYEIKFVEHEAIFYQMGQLQTFDIICELFEYSQEEFNTGVANIDVIETTESIPAAMARSYIATEANSNIVTQSGIEIINDGFSIRDTDPTDRSDEFQSEGSGIIDFSERNPFGVIE